jgi:phospholipid N-methyltransferase
MTESNGTSLREHALLFSRFLRSPRTVGALTASSRALAEAMVDGIALDRPGRIVELGPGTGAFTGAIVERLGAETQFFAVDIDPEFVRQIQRRWPHVECVCASAERLASLVADRGMGPIDHIVSGLPFVSLPPQMTKQILANVVQVLRPGGTFATFQYLHGYGLPPAIAFRRGMTAQMGSAPIARLVLRNLPPALVLTWTKTGAELVP